MTITTAASFGRMSAVLLFLGAVDWCFADPVKVGPEIQITFDGSTDQPLLASDPAGNFLVVWWNVTNDELEGQGFYATGNSQGPVFRMSAADQQVREGGFDTQGIVSVAADPAGNFVVAYNAYDSDAAYGAACYGSPCVYTRRRDANGVLAPASFIVGDPRLNAYYGEPYNQTANPELAADGLGNFVVAWEGYDVVDDGEGGYTGGGEAVWARRLVNSGQVNSGPFRVNEVTYSYQGDGGELDVASDDAGNFTVVWRDENHEYPPFAGVVMGRFDRFKNPLGSQQSVTPSVEHSVRVATTGGGSTMVVWGDSPVRGRVYDPQGTPVGPEFDVAASAFDADVSASGPDAFVVVYDRVAGISGQRFDTAGAPIGGEFAVAATGGDPKVASDAIGNFVVAWGADDIRVQRFELEAPQPVDAPLLGKVLTLSNKIPDDFEKSTGKWGAGGSVVSPPRGSASDPRCNGDPAGTVKATVQFASATSGEDTGPILLPCEKWTATGSNAVSAVAKRGFKYADSQAVHGPCSAVSLTGTKSVSVTCKGKAGAASFPYDLVAGVDQGAVKATLTLGNHVYCAEFQPFVNGSDGKQYKGKAVAAPASCL